MAPQEKLVPYPSSVGFKYPSHRDDPRSWADLWIEDKKAIDGAEGLWRIHNKIYDLNDWIDKHPGGKDWIRLTKGTDITEQFETHHISTTAAQILPKFYIRDATSPRNSPFTFEDNGFYKTLKSRVRETLKNIPKSKYNHSMFITDILMISFIATAAMTAIFNSFLIGFVSGTILNMLTIASHNFFHQKDNFRMYYFDFFWLSHRDWRISHAMSHHLFTNTVMDLEVSLLEPFLLYLPKENTFWQRVLSCIISPGVWIFLIPANALKKYANLCMGIVKDVNILAEILPFTVPVMMFFLGGMHFWQTLFLYAWIILVGSFYFGFFGFNAAHHHPELFHDGDTPRSNPDWGLFQMGSVIDRHEINRSSFLVLVTFGDHVLHHLFPTLDHSTLPKLYPDLQKTCEEFNVKYRMISQWNLIVGMFAQLLRMEVNPHEPGVKWNWYTNYWEKQKKYFWDNVLMLLPKKRISSSEN